MSAANTREVQGTDELDRPGLSGEPNSRLKIVLASDVALDVFCPTKARGAVPDAAYELWHSVWLATFRHLAGASHLDSNEFTRQDEILALSHAGVCISITALRWIDRTTRIGREDSYFRPWPPDALQKIGPLLAVSSNTVIAETFRGARIQSDGAEPQRLSELIIGMALRRFAASKFHEFIGVARNDRKMDRVAAALGGKVIGRIIVHGIESDIMLFARSALPAFGPAIEEIWTRRSGCVEENDS